LPPRFNGGNPPDVIDNSGAKLLPVSTLATSGQLADLTPLFDAASVDDAKVKVRDSVEKITLEAADLGGKPQQLNYVLKVYGLWYNKKLFTEGLAAGQDLGRIHDAVRHDQEVRHRAAGPPGQVPGLHRSGAARPRRQAWWQGSHQRDRRSPAERLDAPLDQARRRGAARGEEEGLHHAGHGGAWTTSTPRRPGTRARRPSSPAVRGWRTYENDWGTLFAALTIAMLPVVVVYLIFYRQVQAGLTSATLK
jgi:hypothetical protein